MGNKPLAALADEVLSANEANEKYLTALGREQVTGELTLENKPLTALALEQAKLSEIEEHDNEEIPNNAAMKLIARRRLQKQEKYAEIMDRYTIVTDNMSTHPALAASRNMRFPSLISSLRNDLALAISERTLQRSYHLQLICDLFRRNHRSLIEDRTPHDEMTKLISVIAFELQLPKAITTSVIQACNRPAICEPEDRHYDQVSIVPVAFDPDWDSTTTGTQLTESKPKKHVHFTLEFPEYEESQVTVTKKKPKKKPVPKQTAPTSPTSVTDIFHPKLELDKTWLLSPPAMCKFSEHQRSFLPTLLTLPSAVKARQNRFQCHQQLNFRLSYEIAARHKTFQLRVKLSSAKKETNNQDTFIQPAVKHHTHLNLGILYKQQIKVITNKHTQAIQGLKDLPASPPTLLHYLDKVQTPSTKYLEEKLAMLDKAQTPATLAALERKMATLQLHLQLFGEEKVTNPHWWGLS